MIIVTKDNIVIATHTDSQVYEISLALYPGADEIKQITGQSEAGNTDPTLAVPTRLVIVIDSKKYIHTTDYTGIIDTVLKNIIPKEDMR